LCYESRKNVENKFECLSNDDITICVYFDEDELSKRFYTELPTFVLRERIDTGEENKEIC